VISIAAGITIGYLEKIIGLKPVIRAMPNNPALVQKGMTAICPGTHAKQSDVELALSIFSAVGAVIQIIEELMDAVTGLSGSGPAFVYLVVEAMVEAGEKLGLTKSVAEILAFNTVLGSAETLIRTRKQAKELREMVTSPGGTTRAGLDVLESRGFSQILSDAIIAAAKRANELSKL
jgi:pyrroline-5-carboxylate reductase